MGNKVVNVKAVRTLTVMATVTQVVNNVEQVNLKIGRVWFINNIIG